MCWSCMSPLVPYKADSSVRDVKPVREGVKPPGKTYASWEDYDKSVAKWRETYKKMEPMPLGSSGYLYHATQSKNLASIAKNGLQPRDPRWNNTYDASKDGVLSMATTESGAGAMGGNAVLLRVAKTNVLNLEFRLASATEVRTFSTIAPAYLEKKDDKGTWVRV
jgi:hypothetical protein